MRWSPARFLSGPLPSLFPAQSRVRPAIDPRGPAERPKPRVLVEAARAPAAHPLQRASLQLQALPHLRQSSPLQPENASVRVQGLGAKRNDLCPVERLPDVRQSLKPRRDDLRPMGRSFRLTSRLASINLPITAAPPMNDRLRPLLTGRPSPVVVDLSSQRAWPAGQRPVSSPVDAQPRPLWMLGL